MPAKRRISEDTRAAIVSDFMSDMNHAAVGKKYGFELPKGYVVHHKDEDKLNNCPSNLEIMTISDHMLLHAHLRYMKKVQRLSREGVESKCSRSAQEPETTGS